MTGVESRAGRFSWLAGAALVIGVTASAQGATLGQADDFEDGSVMNWAGSFSGITNQTTGGPAGADDHYLQIYSSGLGGSGSRMITFNRSQWAGDYTGITAITADVIAQTPSIAVEGVDPAETLSLRIAIGNSLTSTWYASATPVVISLDDPWAGVQFDFSDLVLIGGAGDLGSLLSSSTELRILSSVNLPTIGSGGSPQGDIVYAQLGVDNITAVPEPASLVTLALGGLLVSRRRRA